jgi:hypothetical protein
LGASGLVELADAVVVDIVETGDAAVVGNLEAAADTAAVGAEVARTVGFEAAVVLDAVALAGNLEVAEEALMTKSAVPSVGHRE